MVRHDRAARGDNGNIREQQKRVGRDVACINTFRYYRRGFVFVVPLAMMMVVVKLVVIVMVEIKC